MEFDMRYLIFLSMIFICQCQSITEPKLTSIEMLNSTALKLNWLFANLTYDQSNFVQLTIQFIEFTYNYNYTYPDIVYTYTLNNKTSLTSLTKNFQLVNGFVYLCFSSNSTITNSSQNFYFKTCQLARTCPRATTSNCPQASFVILSASDITTNSFTINIHWLLNLPYIRSSPSSSVKLINTATSGTTLSASSNGTYYNEPFRFSSLSSQTNYTVNVLINYTIFNSFMSENLVYSVITSHSSGRTSHVCLLWSILVFVFFFLLFN